MGWSKDPGPPLAGKTPAFSMGENMSTLSIFVDESGDFGEYDHRAPYYIISLVFHDQHSNIENDISILEREMSNIGYPCHCIHVGPIIRKENEFEFEDLEVHLMTVHFIF